MGLDGLDGGLWRWWRGGDDEQANGQAVLVLGTLSIGEDDMQRSFHGP